MMNSKIIGFCILVIYYGCKVNKEKSERLEVDRYTANRYQSNNSWSQHNSRDSSYSYWYVSGDSGFFFHPDVGLWSRSGQMAYIEQRAVAQQIKQMVKTHNTVSIDSSKTVSQRASNKSTNRLSKWGWLLLLIPIATVIYWCWRKFLFRI